MSRRPYHVLRSALQAVVLGHEHVLDHLAFGLSAEAGAAGVSVRTLLLADPGAGTEHLIEVLGREVGIPTVTHDLDTPEYDSGEHEEAGLRHALMRLGMSADADAPHAESGVLLILRGYVAAAAADRTDWRGGVAGGPRLAAALRVVQQRLPWSGSRDGRPPWPGALAIVAIDEATPPRVTIADTRRTDQRWSTVPEAVLRALGVPDAFVDAFPRRYSLRARTAPALEAILHEADELRAVLDAAFSLGVDVTVSPQTIGCLAAACARGQLGLRQAIDLLCERVEHTVRHNARVDPFGPLAPPTLIAPDDILLKIRKGG